MVRLVVRRSSLALLSTLVNLHKSCRSAVVSGPFWAQTALKRGVLPGWVSGTLSQDPVLPEKPGPVLQRQRESGVC